MVDMVKQLGARSYGQYCGLARALDIVGERWNLLIVRELLPGALRYNELKSSLAGIASNLLAERLRTLEDHGILERQLGGTGVVYALTPWGAELRESMEALGRWGAPLVATGRGSDSFQPRWLVLALPALLQGITATPAVELGLDVEGFNILLHIDDHGPRTTLSHEWPAKTILEASPEVIVGLAAGAITVAQARPSIRVHGEANVLDTVFPAARSVAVSKPIPNTGKRAPHSTK